MTLLNGVLDARGKVLLKLNVDEAHKDAVLAVLPSMKSPTVSPLSDGGYAVESVIEKRRSTSSSRTLARGRCHRPARDAHLQDRPVTERPRSAPVTELARGRGLTGRVVLFDAAVGLGEIESDGGATPVPLHRDRRRHVERDRGRHRGQFRSAAQVRASRSGEHPVLNRASIVADERVLRERRIIDVLMSLNEGEVTTYGDVADVAGYPKQSRLVGRILRETALDVPWWRVVERPGPDPHRPTRPSRPSCSRKRMCS